MVLGLSGLGRVAAAQTLSVAKAMKSKGQVQLRMGPGCGGGCVGDLNADGRLNEIDLMVFDLYESTFPQNLCADLNDDGVVDKLDRGLLINIINTSGGSCDPACGTGVRDCYTASDPLPPTDPAWPSTIGCNDPDCCSRVCVVEPSCCDIVWDADCVTIASQYCVAEAPDVRPDAGDCLCVHEFLGEDPCSNRLLADVVCAINSDCRGQFDPVTQTFQGTWDQTCAELATFVIISQPGLQIRAFPSSALLAETGDIEAQIEEVRALLCLINPIYCGQTGAVRFRTELREDCLDVLAQNYPGCVEDYDVNGIWDAACAQIADQLCRWPDPLDIGAGDCLRVGTASGCSDAYCTSVVCDLDPSCCNAEWDENCVRLAGRLCLLVPDPASGRPGVSVIGADQAGDLTGTGFGCGSSAAGACCYENFSPYCDDAACCQLVCSFDYFCCDSRWDETCAKLATDGCALLEARCTCGFKLVEYGPPGRSCFEARPVGAQWPTGCADGECCNSVCLIDPYCCEASWDQACADGASFVCIQTCEDAFGNEVPCYPACAEIISGSCYVEREEPGCDAPRCCQAVCAIDPKCCDIAWEAPCVEFAIQYCNNCGDTYAGNCLVPSLTPACSDALCCNTICQVDSFCCDVQWDGACADEAQLTEECAGLQSCGEADGRSCYFASLQAGCSDASCCGLICDEFDPWCCDVRWDEVCASQAFVFCNPPSPGGGREPCDVRHATPGCNVPDCASRVCSVPGYETCCTNRWDTNCVAAADALCVGIYECPGTGDCKKAHATPLCNDPACCNGVCAIDPACCRIEWDTQCAVMAIEICRAPASSVEWECPCEGSCFSLPELEEGEEPRPRPGCNDTSCCTVVCQIDSACCTVDWDEGCVALANARCASPPACGAASAGDCLLPNETPYCEDSTCCSTVCSYDPACCTQRWDSFCVATALDRCRRGCGLATAGPCYYPHPSPGCEDEECCVAVCDEDPFCCSTYWDDTCAYMAIGDPENRVPGLCTPIECGDFLAGDCCTLNFSPSCNDKRCCNAVCDADEFCCDTTWDLACVELARQETLCKCGADWQCGDVCAGDCCEPNFSPKCNDASCCDAICKLDTFCCDVEWDEICANTAVINPDCNGAMDACPKPECGDPLAGECCFANGTPACNDADCCDQVCAIDPVCCDIVWDGICAATATVECSLCNGTLECGDPGAGSCTVPNNTPYCDDEACCNLVCQIEIFCCLGEWDSVCVEIAELLCN